MFVFVCVGEASINSRNQNIFRSLLLFADVVNISSLCQYSELIRWGISHSPFTHNKILTHTHTVFFAKSLWSSGFSLCISDDLSLSLSLSISICSWFRPLIWYSEMKINDAAELFYVRAHSSTSKNHRISFYFEDVTVKDVKKNFIHWAFPFTV